MTMRPPSHKKKHTEIKEFIVHKTVRRSSYAFTFSVHSNTGKQAHGRAFTSYPCLLPTSASKDLLLQHVNLITRMTTSCI